MKCMAAAQQSERHRCPFPARVCYTEVFRLASLGFDAHTHLHDRPRRRSYHFVRLSVVVVAAALRRRLDDSRRSLEVLQADRAPS